MAGRAAAEQACLKRRLHAEEADGRQYVTLLEAAGLDRLRAAAAERKEGIARARTRRMEQAAVEEDEDARDEAGDRALRTLHDLRQEARQAKRELEGLMAERARLQKGERDALGLAEKGCRAAVKEECDEAVRRGSAGASTS